MTLAIAMTHADARWLATFFRAARSRTVVGAESFLYIAVDLRGLGLVDRLSRSLGLN